MNITRDARRDRLQRLRLYVITGEGGGVDDTARIVEAALAGGADVIQLRKKAMPPDERYQLAQQLRELTRAHDALLIVNDDPALAVAVDADGVHLGQEDMEPGAVRGRFDFDQRLIGRSTHSLEQARAALADTVDYLGVGPIFATPTKPGRQAVGLDLVTAVAPVVSIPFVAIGGIDQTNAGSVLQAGARAIAVVRAVYDDADPARAARTLRRLVMASEGVPVR